MCIRDRDNAVNAQMDKHRIRSHERLVSLIDSFLLDPDSYTCLLYTSDAADERSSVDLGGRRIIKKKKKKKNREDT